MKFEEIRNGIDSFLDSVAEGWRHLRQSAANALTRFMPDDQSRLPSRGDIDDPLYMPARSWSMLGGEVFEDDTRLVVRIEVPGLEKDDMSIEVFDDSLVLSGEKRFERESTDGRWRVMQCAYGRFRRVVPLSTPVLADEARASYKNGVLRVELRKARPSTSEPRTIKVE